MRGRFRVALVDYDEDLFAPQGWEGDVIATAGAEWVVGRNRTPETVLAASQGADVVMIQSVRRLLTREIIQRLDSCRGIIRVGIGYDSVDMAACTESGIALCNVPEYCVHEVADHSLALLLAAVRHLGRQDRWIREGRWDRTGAKPARRLYGQTLGLVGFGRVARSLTDKVRGLGWRVMAFDPFLSAEVMSGYGAEWVTLDDLLRQADLISVQAPLTAQTRHLLGEREFGLVKPGVIVVNTSRGPVIDEVALVEALRSGKVGAAGLDVFENEPLGPDNPLLKMDNVTLTPHVAGYAEEAVGDMYRGACQTAVDLLKGVWPAAALNPAARASWTARWSAC
jgi:D-3-phosphoglycerate dehydrogenase / 2-oxoglutarate reductase